MMWLGAPYVVPTPPLEPPPEIINKKYIFLFLNPDFLN